MPAGLDDIRSVVRADKKKGQKLLVCSVIFLVVFCIVILCFDYDKFIDYDVIQWISPWEVCKSLYYGAKLKLVYLFQGKSDLWNQTFQIYYHQLPDADGPTKRLLQILLTMVSGAVLSLSGTVYQTAMRNPMAVPTMLGVTSSVSLAKMLILVNVGISAFYNMSWKMYAVCYGLSAVVILIILLAGKLSGGKHVSVVDMLLAGTIINRLIQSYVTYLQDTIDEDTLMAYQEVSERSYEVFGQLKNLGTLLIVTLIVMIPILLMRFSYNAISFEDDDARCFGVNPNAMRIYAMVGGAILTTATMIHYGNIGVLALIVPHICRYTFGTEFRRVVTTSAFYGAFILVIGWYISNYTWIGLYQIPVGSIISVIVIPVLLWFSFKQRRGWN